MRWIPIEIIDKQMLENPRYWQSHYHGDENDLRLARKYSYSDRIRYYWPNPQISTSLARLIENLKKEEVPLNLLSQYLPMQYQSIIENKITNTIENLIFYGVARVLNIYAYAVGELN